MTIEVFDPAMSCWTGVHGPSVDPWLASFAADLGGRRPSALLVVMTGVGLLLGVVRLVTRRSPAQPT